MVKNFMVGRNRKMLILSRVMEESLSIIIKKIKLVGAGRTDTGVHAKPWLLTLITKIK